MHSRAGSRPRPTWPCHAGAPACDGLPAPQREVEIALEEPGYRYETPRLASGPVIRTSDRDIVVALRLAQPALAVLQGALQGVLSPEECRQIIAQGRQRLRPSTVTSPRTGRDSVAELMNHPLRNGEGFHLLRYHPGTGSAPHVDFLTPGTAANDVERGGETVFPKVGLAVTPRQGHAVHVEYANSHGEVDLKSVHAAAPVQAGEKWVLTRWVRERAFVSA